MKKSYAIALGAVVLFAGCNENLEVTPEIQKNGVYATIQQPEAPVSVKSLDWNANKFNFTWSEGENVVVFGGSDKAAFNTLTAGSETSELQSTAFKLQDGVDYYACIPAYKFDMSSSLEAVPVNLLGQVQSSNNNTDHLKYYNYACAAATKEEGSNSLSFNLKNQVSWIVLEHTFTEAQNVLSFNIATDEAVFPVEGTMNVKTSTFTPTKKQSVLSLQVGDKNNNSGLSFQAGETFRGFITVAPVDLTGKTLLISASLSNGNSIELGTITAKGAISANKPVIICTSGSSTSAVATLDGVEYASLQAAISASEDESKEITILKDIELSQPLQLFSENRVTINLNGKNVITTSNTGVLFDGGHLTIKGSGTFGDPTQKTTAYLFNMKAYSVMTVEGDATFYSALDCFYLENETTLGYVDLYIKGGKWIGGEQNGVYWTINKYDKAAGDINVSVTGGEFYKYNPAASHSENPVANFVADGYGVIKNGDWYKVVKATEVTDEASLKSAISSSKSVPVIVDNTIELESSYVSLASGYNLIVSENGKIIPSSTYRADVGETISTANKTGVINISGTGSIEGPSNTTDGNGGCAIEIMGSNTSSTKLTVNIYGNLTVKGGSGGVANNAINIVNGIANIYGGYFYAGLDKNNDPSEKVQVIYLRPGWRQTATLNIYDGVFECAGDPSFLINCLDSSVDDNKCTIKIMGGTFIGFDPSNSSADKIDGKNANWVPDGYVSTRTTYNGKTAWVVSKDK